MNTLNTMSTTSQAHSVNTVMQPPMSAEEPVLETHSDNLDRLTRAIINRAMSDALTITSNHASSNAIDAAEWLFSHDDDSYSFSHRCEQVDINPEWIHRLLIEQKPLLATYIH
ncbi:MAG: hypothetical protein HN708_15575 [Candidatus Marinimicrobia bacterium]|jgi:hypothetical protein|nr:hypothetical protein [Candidatus Neomarinimicrobiota bacterium]